MKKGLCFLLVMITLNSLGATVSISNRTDQTIYVRDNRNHHYWVWPNKVLHRARLIGKVRACWVFTKVHKKNSNCIPLTEVEWPLNSSACVRVSNVLIVTGTCDHRIDPNDGSEFCRDRLSPTVECR